MTQLIWHGSLWPFLITDSDIQLRLINKWEPLKDKWQPLFITGTSTDVSRTKAKIKGNEKRNTHSETLFCSKHWSARYTKGKWESFPSFSKNYGFSIVPQTNTMTFGTWYSGHRETTLHKRLVQHQTSSIQTWILKVYWQVDFGKLEQPFLLRNSELNSHTKLQRLIQPGSLLDYISHWTELQKAKARFN